MDRLTSLALFLIWLPFSTAVPAKIVRFQISAERPAQTKSSVDQEFIDKLYARLLKEMAAEEATYQLDFNHVVAFEGEISQSIRDSQRKLIEYRQAIAEMAQQNDELKLKDKYLTDQLERSSIPADVIKRELGVVRAQRRANDVKMDQYGDAVKQLINTIDHLGRYPISQGAGWNTGATQAKNVYEAKQYFQLALTEVQNERDLTQRQYAAWQMSATPNESTLKGLIAYATAQNVQCSVDITSQKDSTETIDATVRYQTPEQRQFGAKPKSAKSPTKCLDEKMKPNRYYMWTERDGRETSSPDALYPIVEASEKLTLKER